MEMLIVIAIIAVLIAIAVPVFNSQVTRAKIETDNANLRTAQAVAMAKFMDGEHATGTHKNGWFYNDTEEYYGYYFDPATATCVCDGTNSKTGTRDEARYLEGHGYGQTPSLRAKAGAACCRTRTSSSSWASRPTARKCWQAGRTTGSTACT